MKQISAGKVLASIAITMRIERALVMTILTVTNTHQAIGYKVMTIARITGWHHAVEHIDATTNCFHNIFWLADAHQITWFIFWHFSWQIIQYFDHFFFRFTHRKTANGITIKTNFK